MIVKILNEFRDKDDFSKLYEKGSTVEFETDRAKTLIELGLVEDVENSKEDDINNSDLNGTSDEDNKDVEPEKDVEDEKVETENPDTKPKKK